METNLETTAKQPGQLSARIWLVIAFTIFVGYIAGQLGSFLFPGALQAYGVGFEQVTLEGIFIQAGFFTIYGILATLPLLMVIGYQRSQLVTLKSKIREDLWLCGLDSRQLTSKMLAFGERNSWGSYILPAVLTMIFLAVLWNFFLMPAGQSGLSLSLQGEKLNGELFRPNLLNMLQTIADSASVITMCFLGAYFYISSVLTRRWLRSDLTTGVLWKINVRLAVAVLVGFLLAAAAPGAAKADASGLDHKVLLMIGFLAGIVPETVLRWLSQQARRIISPKGERKGGLFMPSDLQEKIEGLNFWQVDRLFEEGIESVQDLAMKEIPDLLIETRFDTPRILYWVDQALLSNQAGDQMQLFEGAFIKTASDLIDLAEKNGQDLEKVLQAIQDGQQNRPAGQATDGAENAAYVITLPLLENIIEGLRNGPNLPYAREYWRNTNTPQRRAEKLAELDKLA